ncbi:MAG: glycosyltransferase family 4 protein [Promethearchaeota archaeon]
MHQINVLLLFTYGVSMKRWFQTGISSREISNYRFLSKKEINYFFLTFGCKDDIKYISLNNNMKVIPVKDYIKSKIPKVHYFKSLFLPAKIKNIILKSDIIKTNQIIGSWIAITAKILYHKKIIIRGGYEKLIRHKLIANRKGMKSNLKYLMDYYWIFLLELLAYKLADGIILTNKNDISFIIKCFRLKKKAKKGKILHLYNFIDTDLFKPTPQNEKMGDLLFIGSLKHQKNLSNLLHAIKELKKVRLTIVGDGPLRSSLNDLVKRMNLNVKFLGTIPNEQLPEIINKHEIFILPSIWEGNPKALMEAMSCGLPCICSNIPGINDIIIHKKNGYLCGTSLESIRNAITDLLKNEKLKNIIAENARDFVLQNCSLNVIAEREYNFYLKVLKS